MGTGKKYWAAEKREGVADSVRSSACIPAAWKSVRIRYFFRQNEKKKLIFRLLGGLQSELQNGSNSSQSHWNTLV